MATKHLVLAGAFITADPFPLQELVTEYESSLLGMWDDLPAWDTLQEYAKQLQKAQLAIPGDAAYRSLREAFLPVDPETQSNLGPGKTLDRIECSASAVAALANI